MCDELTTEIKLTPTRRRLLERVEARPMLELEQGERRVGGALADLGLITLEGHEATITPEGSTWLIERPRRGRRFAGDLGLRESLSVRITGYVAQELDAMAELEGTTRNAIARKLLKAAVDARRLELEASR